MQLKPKDKAVFKVNAYCMNIMCGCSNNEKIALTDFQIDDVKGLESQGSVWDYLNKSLLNRKEEYKEEVQTKGKKK